MHERYVNRHLGMTAWIVGKGRSLDDWDYVTYDLPVLGINDAAKRVPPQPELYSVHMLQPGIDPARFLPCQSNWILYAKRDVPYSCGTVPGVLGGSAAAAASFAGVLGIQHVWLVGIGDGPGLSGPFVDESYVTDRMLLDDYRAYNEAMYKTLDALGITYSKVQDRGRRCAEVTPPATRSDS